jgi:hypothetical protein
LLSIFFFFFLFNIQTAWSEAGTELSALNSRHVGFEGVPRWIASASVLKTLNILSNSSGERTTGELELKNMMYATLFTPGEVCAKVEDKLMGTITAPEPDE